MKKFINYIYKDFKRAAIFTFLVFAIPTIVLFYAKMYKALLMLMLLEIVIIFSYDKNDGDNRN